MLEGFTTALHFLTNLLQSPGWAALLGAGLAATATHLWHLRREHNQRVRELRGITRLLYKEMESNRKRLSAVSRTAPPGHRNRYKYLPATSVWDKANLRLAHLLKDDKLLTGLVDYYTQAHDLARYIQVSSDAPQLTINLISLNASYLIDSSNKVQPLLQKVISKTQPWWRRMWGG